MTSSVAHAWAPAGGIPWDDLGAVQGYDAAERYGVSKLANVYFASELSRRYGPQGVLAVSLHPGAVPGTRLGRSVGLRSGLSFVSKLARSPSALLLPMFGWDAPKTVAQGAATTVFCALAPAAALVPGAYYVNSALGTDREADVARSAEQAERLWRVTEELIAQKCP